MAWADWWDSVTVCGLWTPPPPHPLKIRNLARLSIRVPCVSLMLFFGLKKILVNLTFFTGLLRTWTLDPARLRIQKTVEYGSETLLSCCSPPTMLPLSRTDREINKLQLTSLIAGYKRVCVCVCGSVLCCVCVCGWGLNTINIGYPAMQGGRSSQVRLWVTIQQFKDINWNTM